MRLANTIGDRINKFDELEWFDQTIESFNELFPECPIKDNGNTAWIKIGQPESNNRRTIFLFEHQDSCTVIEHKMFSDIMYTVDKGVYYMDERDTELTEINGVPV